MDEVVDSSEESHLRVIRRVSIENCITSGILLQGMRFASLITAAEPDPTQDELRNIKNAFYCHGALYESEGLNLNGIFNYLRHCSSFVRVTILNFYVLQVLIVSGSYVWLDPTWNELVKALSVSLMHFRVPNDSFNRV